MALGTSAPPSRNHVAAVSWNIHRARGADGKVAPGRILRTLAAEVCPLGTADILALQEADGECPPHGGLVDPAAVEAATGLRHAQGAAHLRWGPLSHGFLGTVLYLRPEWEVRHADVIDLPGHCHRGAVAVEVACGATPLRIVSTHLSLAQVLRIAQMRIIGQYVFRRPAMQTLLLGDLNEWRPWGGLAFRRGVCGLSLTGPARATFPARWPLLPLDRVLSDRPGAVCAVEVPDGPGLRAASDHRPIRAMVRVAP